MYRAAQVGAQMWGKSSQSSDIYSEDSPSPAAAFDIQVRKIEGKHVQRLPVDDDVLAVIPD